jgi:outer membrane protein assembly factor BamB
MSKNIAKATATIFVILTIASLVLITTVGAQTTLPAGVTPTNPQSSSSIPLPAGVTPDVTLDTIAHISFTPNPVGVGQTILVNIWFQPPIHVSRALSGLQVVITKPDGTKDTIGPIETYRGDATAWFEYPVDQTGAWKLRFDFPGGYFPAGNYTIASGAAFGGGTVNSFPLSAYYKPATTGDRELIVQQDMVMSWPALPLPTDYWIRPISPENRNWWVIAGHSPFHALGGGSEWPVDTNKYMSNYKFTPWVQGPESAHIVWRVQGSVLAGIVSGETGQLSAPKSYDEAFNTATGAYNAGPGSNGNPAILFAGRLYGKVMGVFNGTPMYIWRCTDVRTGEVIWEQPWTSQMPTIVSTAFDAPLVPGATQRADRLNMALVDLGGGRLIKYSPTNGQVNSNISISPLTTGTVYADPYVLSVQDLGANATNQPGGRYRLINWTMESSTTNFTARIMNNISWPLSSLPGTCDFEAGVAVTTGSITSQAVGVTTDAIITAVNINTGQLLWNKTLGIGYGTYSGSTACADHGKFAVRMNDGFYYCWDLNTGNQLWKSESTSWPWDTFGAYYVSSAYGYLYDPTYAGLRALDWDTGKAAWVFEAPTPFQYETPYQGQYSWFSGNIIADGKIYAYNLEHSPSAPLTRGWKLFCVNATTGQGIWNITGSMAPGVIADGYLTACNWYDGYMYVFGKGKTATTVTAPDVAIAKGNGIIIKGTVLDQSPAQPSTPCVSKDSMETQMEYLYMQHPIDGLNHNITMTGVPVTLTAIDSNNNAINIGTVITSPYYGTFEMAWTPPNEGTYKIIASFAGDDSYASSASSTAISVGPAPATINVPQQTTPSDYTIILIVGFIAVIIAVAIVGLLVVRKK